MAARGAPQAVYVRIANALRGQIESGQLEPGQQLPTEHALGAEYEVARATVRQALTLLKNEGLIIPARPRGYFVRKIRRSIYRPQAEFRPRPHFAEMDQWMEEQAEDGREPSQTINVEIVNPPHEIANRLGLKPDEMTVVRRRIRYLDGEPFNANDSYFPLSLVSTSEIMVPHDIQRGANEVLAELGARQVRAIDEIEVRMPTPTEATQLDLGPGTPVAVIRSTGYTADDRPVRAVVTVLPGTKHVIVFERDRLDPDD
ncbi:GntR family transcriptional regulator [Actinokineospora alba]|uniref:GntR family transcriptional regulator n=1 Tax=Actinokineospora alba TaxID=504798 RepID=A0A1H0VA36_9PSEU|nr:GntR family transcriptional regulator [Actinokineospora alba]SDH65777.1 GntR family transcriptional regulator [Actinokineospora alba]SDP75233.1 GntR family transcriptional regulator [Actinokineospora alba]